MSGIEWTIVTVIGVCLIFLFVVLEIFFPAPDTTDHTFIDESDARDHQPAVRSASSHTLR